MNEEEPVIEPLTVDVRPSEVAVRAPDAVPLQRETVFDVDRVSVFYGRSPARSRSRS